MSVANGSASIYLCKFVSRLQVLALASVKICKIDMGSGYRLVVEAQRLQQGITSGLDPIQFKIRNTQQEMRIGVIRIAGNGFLEELNRVRKFLLFQLTVAGTSQCRSVVSVDLQSAFKIRRGFFQFALCNL